MDGGEYAKGWAVPMMQQYALMQGIGTLGAVIMPHNLYLHSGLCKSRKIDRNFPRRVAEGNYYNTIESGLALLVSFFINAAIVVTFAVAFFEESCASNPEGPFGCVPVTAIAAQSQTIKTYSDCSVTSGPGKCAEIGLELAGDALHHALGGGSSKYIWGVGLLAAGQAATMTTTYAGQFVMSGFFSMDIPAWAVVSITRVIALGPATALALVAGGNASVSADMNEWLNALQSLQLPFALLPVLHFTNSRRIMGIFANKTHWKVVYWVVAAALVGLNLYFVIDFIYIDENSPVYGSDVGHVLSAIYLVVYLFFVGAILQDELRAAWRAIAGTPKPISVPTSDADDALLNA